MLSRRFHLLTVAGIPLRLDISWFLVAILLTWSLAGSLPALHPDIGGGTEWLLGIAGTLGLFGSVVLHELAHALMARRYGTPTRSITLFVFGGVAELEDEPPFPFAEFAIAIAGPAASLLIAGGTLVAAVVLWAAGAPPGLHVLASFLGVANLGLAVFNLLPAFPLDGGRVLRAALWHRWGDLLRATATAARIGSGFGMALIALGAWSALVSRDAGGLWTLLLGMFVRQAASRSYRHALVRENLAGQPVRSFLARSPLTVSRAAPVLDLAETYFRQSQGKPLPVLDGDRLLGVVTADQVQSLPRSEWDRQSVGSIMTPSSPENTLPPDADVTLALRHMRQQHSPLVLVAEAGRFVGVVWIADLLQHLARALDTPGRPDPSPRP